MNSNFCVSCGQEIPDGSQVCYNCIQDRSDKALDAVKAIFDEYADCIYPVNIKPNDVILFTYDSTHQTLSEAKTILKNLGSVFPHNKILMIPDNITIDVQSNGATHRII